jgi:hypothetical protein
LLRKVNNQDEMLGFEEKGLSQVSVPSIKKLGMKRILSYDRISEKNSFEEDSYDNFLNFQRSKSQESVIVK